jgi:hypothetical protein
MPEYPDYVPSWFAMGRLRGWAANDPRRVIAWFGGMSLVATGIIILAAIAGNIVLLIGGGIALIDLMVEGVIYLPRARRATHRGHTTSS